MDSKLLFYLINNLSSNDQMHHHIHNKVDGKLIFNNLAEDPAVFQVSNTSAPAYQDYLDFELEKIT